MGKIVLSLSLDLSSVTAKLGRASDHAKAIKDEIIPRLKPDLYSITDQANADFTRHSIIFHIKSGDPPPLERWGLIAGDCVHNLRCTLDHLVYAIAIHESGVDPPPCASMLQFPICDSDAAFDREVGKNRLGTISNNTVATIKGLQPYNRRQPEGPPLLAILRDFDNRDKHRLLRVAMSVPAELDIGLVGESIAPDNLGRFHGHRGELKDGAEIAAVTFLRPSPDVHFDRKALTFRFVFKLSPRETGVSDPSFGDVVGMLSAMIGEVHFVVNSLTK